VALQREPSANSLGGLCFRLSIQEKFFHGLLSGAAAQKLLASSPAGAFLFRFSSQAPGLALTYKTSTKVEHLRLERTTKLADSASYSWSLDGKWFGTLLELVQTYRQSPLPNAEGTLLRDAVLVAAS
jgi:hypothetical protein